MTEIRAVVNECGVAMELHGHADNPILITLIRPIELEAYRNQLSTVNPDMRYCSIGQLAVRAAKQMYSKANIQVSDYAWTYNASDNRYSR